MKSIITVLLSAAVIIFGTGCSSSSDKNPSLADKDFLEGWAGHPEKIKQKPFEYYYRRRGSRIPILNRERLIGAAIQNRCIEGNIANGKADFMIQMIYEALIGAEGINDVESTGKRIVPEFYGKIDLKASECRPLAEIHPDAPGFEWKECECIVYARVPGGKNAILTRAEELEKAGKK